MGGLFSAPKAPPPPKPVEMPVPPTSDSQKTRAKRRASIKDQEQRGGRLSTILSDKLGG